MEREKIIEELKSRNCYDFYSLVQIMSLLRGEGGCPWDMEQTHKSIRGNFIEETYEVIEAIDNDDKKLLCEELGDVMLQVVFHARMEEENGEFTIDDVTTGICRKLIERHPHIFGDITVKDTEDVLRNWDKIKTAEKKRKTISSQMDSIPPSLPALMRADKVGSKAAKVGFDFEDAKSAFAKVYEEADEVSEIIDNADDVERLSEEIGDLLFAVTNTSRKLKIDPELALTRATDKFVSRFKAVESLINERGGDMQSMTLAEMDAVWDEVKKNS